MENREELNLEELFHEQKWKWTSKKYLWELQKFLDYSDNIKDEALRKLVVTQMIQCDKTLTQRAEEVFKKLLGEST